MLLWCALAFAEPDATIVVEAPVRDPEGTSAVVTVVSVDERLASGAVSRLRWMWHRGQPFAVLVDSEMHLGSAFVAVVCVRHWCCSMECPSTLTEVQPSTSPSCRFRPSALSMCIGVGFPPSWGRMPWVVWSIFTRPTATVRC